MKPAKHPWLLLVLLLAAMPNASPAEEPSFTSAQKNHWAWKRPARPPLPSVRSAAWLKNPIDAFILAKLEAEGLAPAPPAPREQLLRRVTLDLTGLPPTPADIDAFLADYRPDA